MAPQFIIENNTKAGTAKYCMIENESCKKRKADAASSAGTN